MLRYHKKEIAVALTQLHIKEELEAITLVPEIINVIENFDGKVLNKRFNDAISAIDSNLRVEVREYSIQILWNIPHEKRNILVREKPYGNDYASLEMYEVILAYGLRHIQNPEEKDVLDSEKRIRGNAFVAEVERRAKEMFNNHSQMEKDLEAIDDLIAERDRLIEEVKAFGDKASYTVRGYFDLNLSIQRN